MVSMQETPILGYILFAKPLLSSEITSYFKLVAKASILKLKARVYCIIFHWIKFCHNRNHSFVES